MPDVKKVNSGLLEFSEDQQILVAIDEDGEIQKAVVIDEDGSETPIGTTPTGKITITENGTDIDVAQYATADVAVPAPVSDFSTAVITINSDTTCNIFLPNKYDDVEHPEYSAIYGFIDVEADTPASAEIVLYKGSAIGSVFGLNGTVLATGNIQVDNDILIVTGEGSITITGGLS